MKPMFLFFLISKLQGQTRSLTSIENKFGQHEISQINQKPEAQLGKTRIGIGNCLVGKFQKLNK
jgi:hypothetical protein